MSDDSRSSFELSKILCPVDFSENSELALDYALSLASQHGAKVSVMHVLPKVLADPDVYPYLSDPVLPSGETRERAFEQLGAFVHRALQREVSVDISLDDGDVLEVVLDKAERVPADLIVLGTHGRRGLARLLMGSVAERVLRQATRPVLTVPPKAPKPPEDGVAFERVLCPVDFSPSSLEAYDAALALVGDEGMVTLLHVVEFYIDVVAGVPVSLDLEGLRATHRQQALAKLEETVPREVRERTKLEVVTLSAGSPYKEILRVADEDRFDAIVMGVMGRSAADLFFFGSTTNHVVRTAHCPVVTIRAKG